MTDYSIQGSCISLSRFGIHQVHHQFIAMYQITNFMIICTLNFKLATNLHSVSDKLGYSFE